MNEIDIHAHHFNPGTYIQILNIFAQDLPFSESEKLFSAGIHPWHLERGNQEVFLNSIELASLQKNMLAVGECGLDRSIRTDFAVQEFYFRKQIEIAEKHHKPLIIHCVRAFPELIKLKKETKSTVSWIIHGFQGNKQSTMQLIRNDFYFSVGKSLLTNDLKREILPLVPFNRLFLETDDNEIPISRMYSLASQLLMISKVTLSGIILENFKRLFGNENVVNNNLT